MTSVKNMRVFLSGPMTGIEHYNVEAFARAHAIVKEAGAEYVYDPAMEWLVAEGRESESMTHADWMRRCIHELTRNDLVGGRHYHRIVQLPGWEDSGGALVEAAVADACGIACVELSEVGA